MSFPEYEDYDANDLSELVKKKDINSIKFTNEAL